MRLVPPRSIGSATSLIFSGIAVASVLGVPAGVYLGELVGWRAAFVSAGGVALTVLAALATTLPSLPTEGDVRLGAMLRLAGGAASTPRPDRGDADRHRAFAAYTYAHAETATEEPSTYPLGLAGFGGDFSGVRRFAERDHKNITQ